MPEYSLCKGNRDKSECSNYMYKFVECIRLVILENGNRDDGDMHKASKWIGIMQFQSG